MGLSKDLLPKKPLKRIIGVLNHVDHDGSMLNEMFQSTLFTKLNNGMEKFKVESSTVYVLTNSTDLLDLFFLFNVCNQIIHLGVEFESLWLHIFHQLQLWKEGFVKMFKEIADGKDAKCQLQPPLLSFVFTRVKDFPSTQNVITKSLFDSWICCDSARKSALFRLSQPLVWPYLEDKRSTLELLRLSIKNSNHSIPLCLSNILVPEDDAEIDTELVQIVLECLNTKTSNSTDEEVNHFVDILNSFRQQKNIRSIVMEKFVYTAFANYCREVPSIYTRKTHEAKVFTLFLSNSR
jgi:hypothetical protein